MKKYKSLVSMCALAALANCAKADIISAQEHRDELGNMKSIVVNNPTASIGSVKTPWTFVRPDGNSGFANDFTTNAISVVSENGTNYYAHIEGKDGDRTKVIKFTVDKNGFPSTHGDVINVTNCPAVSAEEMKTRKLVGVANGTLCFYPTEGYGTSLLYNPQLNEVFSDGSENLGESVTQKCLASCQDESTVYVLCNVKYTDYGVAETITRLRGITGSPESMIIKPRVSFYLPLSDENRVIAYRPKKVYRLIIGDSEGKIMIDDRDTGLRLPGAISGITVSDNGKDVFVTSTATNAFCNIGLNDGNDWFTYNAISSENNSVVPTTPKTTDGLIRIIDNRNRGGKLLCVTTKGIHSIDD